MTGLRARGIVVSLGGRRILDGVDIDIKPGEIMALIGPNGAGKSTLLRALANVVPRDAGECLLGEEATKGIAPRSLARRLAYLPQSGDSRWPVDVRTLVMLGRLPHRSPFSAPSPQDEDAVERAMDWCDVARFRHRPVTELSGGERARVLLARALCGEPEVLLADEPVAGLDPGHQLDVMDTLLRMAGSGAAIVIVLHDLTLAARFCRRMALMHEGRIVADGGPVDVLCAENLASYYGIRAHHGNVEGKPAVVPVARSAARAAANGAARR